MGRGYADRSLPRRSEADRRTRDDEKTAVSQGMLFEVGRFLSGTTSELSQLSISTLPLVPCAGGRLVTRTRWEV